MRSFAASSKPNHLPQKKREPGIGRCSPQGSGRRHFRKLESGWGVLDLRKDVLAGSPIYSSLWQMRQYVSTNRGWTGPDRPASSLSEAIMGKLGKIRKMEHHIALRIDDGGLLPSEPAC
jgi:hypothetical protein